MIPSAKKVLLKLLNPIGFEKIRESIIRVEIPYTGTRLRFSCVCGGGYVIANPGFSFRLRFGGVDNVLNALPPTVGTAVIVKTRKRRVRPSNPARLGNASGWSMTSEGRAPSLD